MPQEPAVTTVGLGEEAHVILRTLKEQGVFGEMADGYRFAVALALAHGAIASKLGVGSKTVFNVGSLDPERLLYVCVEALRESQEEPVYRTVERLAEWGVLEIGRLHDNGELSVTALLNSAAAKIAPPRQG